MKNNYRFVFGVEYNGNKYYGWQYQKKLPNIQNKLEKVFSKIANHKIKIYCAGRTDKGVHSIGQVAHFDTITNRKINSWINGANSLLPNDINIKWIKKISKNFHSRYSAISRTYCYIIYNNIIRISILKNLIIQYKYLIDIKIIKKASKYLIGEHNFDSFRSSKCNSISPFRKIFYIKIKNKYNFIYIYIKANSFLHNMVRNIVGCLLKIGSKKKNKNWLLNLLRNSNKSNLKYTISSKGLYLINVEYPKYFNIPN